MWPVTSQVKQMEATQGYKMQRLAVLAYLKHSSTKSTNKGHFEGSQEKNGLGWRFNIVTFDISTSVLN